MMNVDSVIDRNRNLLLLAGFLMLQFLQMALVPVALLEMNSAWGWLLLIPLVFSNSWWAFIHEALHNHLFADKQFGRTMGRVNAVLYGAAFDLLRNGHLLHHAYSRTQRERFEVYDAERETWVAAACCYYFHLLGGLYVLEIVGSLLFLLPRSLILQLEARIRGEDNVVEHLTRRMTEARTLRAVRIDVIAILAVYAVAFYWYGRYWWMLALALWGRGLFISLMDNAFHYGTPLDQPRYAPNLAVPKWWGWLLLHFNLHGVHHRQPSVPWHALPRCHDERRGRYEASLWLAILGQFRGPIPEHALRRDADSSPEG